MELWHSSVGNCNHGCKPVPWGAYQQPTRDAEKWIQDGEAKGMRKLSVCSYLKKLYILTVKCSFMDKITEQKYEILSGKKIRYYYKVSGKIIVTGEKIRCSHTSDQYLKLTLKYMSIKVEGCVCMS